MKRSWIKKRGGLFLALLLVVTAVLPAFAEEGADMERTLFSPLIMQQLEEEGYAEIIVVFEEKADTGRLQAQRIPPKDLPAAVKAELQATARASLARARPGLLQLQREELLLAYRPFWAVNGFFARVRGPALEKLAELPGVAEIVPNFELELFQGHRDIFPYYVSPSSDDLPLHLGWLGAPALWEHFGIDGSGVTVAVMDTGVDSLHPALEKGYSGWYDATPDRRQVPVDKSAIGHGTHVTGLVAGGEPGKQVGVAPGADWIAVRVFDDNGIGQISWVIDGIEWVLGLKKVPSVLNMSFGIKNTYSQLLWEPLQSLRDAGIFVICAGGNYGPAEETIVSPASYPHALAVGAVEVVSQDQDSMVLVAEKSSRGPVSWQGNSYIKPDVVALGTNIISALPGGEYGTQTGTSMAAPQVAGTVALMLQAAPELSVEDIFQHLLEKGYWEEWWGSRPNNDYGHGDVWALRAVASLLVDVPQVSFPQDGCLTTTATITVEGTAYPGSEVTIYLNDEPFTQTESDADGFFSVRIELEPGLNTLQQRAEIAGYVTELSPTISIEYQPEENGSGVLPQAVDNTLIIGESAFSIEFIRHHRVLASEEITKALIACSRTIILNMPGQLLDVRTRKEPAAEIIEEMRSKVIVIWGPDGTKTEYMPCS